MKKIKEFPAWAIPCCTLRRVLFGIYMKISLFLKLKYSRTPVTRTLKGNEKQFELAGVRVIGVD